MSNDAPFLAPTAPDIQAMIRSNVGSPGKSASFEVLSVGDNVADIRVPFDQGMTRLGDTISGPVLMTAADAAMYAVIIGHVEHGEYAVTSHLNIDFLRRPEAADLYARAHILKRGRRTVACRVELFSHDRSTLVAHVTGAYALMRPTTSSE